MNVNFVKKREAIAQSLQGGTTRHCEGLSPSLRGGTTKQSLHLTKNP